MAAAVVVVEVTVKDSLPEVMEGAKAEDMVVSTTAVMDLGYQANVIRIQLVPINHVQIHFQAIRAACRSYIRLEKYKCIPGRPGMDNRRCSNPIL